LSIFWSNLATTVKCSFYPFAFNTIFIAYLHSCLCIHS